MSIFAVGPGGATPPPWLAITVGIVFIVYFAYKMYKEWAGVTWYDLIGATFAIVMGGWFLLWGLGLVGGM